MYEAFFGLSERPFAAPPDPDFWFASEPHATALQVLRDGLSALHPLCVVAAESGHGKTMLIRALLRILSADITVGLIATPSPAIRDLTRGVLLALGQETMEHADSDIEDALVLYLISEYGAGRRCLLLVDEAQHLSAEALASLYHYLDLNSDGDCLLQVVLVGSPDVLATMQDPLLQTWAGRVPLICPIGALPEYEVGPYVQTRLNVACASREIFSEEALAVIAAASGGIPRLINAICDMAMVYAFAHGTATVDHASITRIVSEGRSSSFGALAMLTPQSLSIGEKQNDPFPTPTEDEVAPAFSSEMNDEPELIEIRSADIERDTRDYNPPTPPGAEISDQSIPMDVETLPLESARENVPAAEPEDEAEISDQSISMDVETLPSESARENVPAAEPEDEAEISDQSIPMDVETLPLESARANVPAAEPEDEVAEPEVSSIWPSISGRRVFPTNASPGAGLRSPLRRRFLPRV